MPPEQHGHAGVLEAFGIWPDQWDDFEIEIERIVEDPGDHVVVATLQRGRGRQSGVEVEAEFFFTFEIRNEKIVAWRIFTGGERGRRGDRRRRLGLAGRQCVARGGEPAVCGPPRSTRRAS